MCFGCPKELSHQDGSFEYHEHMFWLRNKKNNFLLCSLIWGPGILQVLRYALLKVGYFRNFELLPLYMRLFSSSSDLILHLKILQENVILLIFYQHTASFKSSGFFLILDFHPCTCVCSLQISFFISRFSKQEDKGRETGER